MARFILMMIFLYYSNFILDVSSFDQVERSIDDVRKERDDVVIVLCGNKTDLTEKRFSKIS